MLCWAGEVRHPCGAVATCASRCDETAGEAILSATVMACEGTRAHLPGTRRRHLAGAKVLHVPKRAVVMS